MFIWEYLTYCVQQCSPSALSPSLPLPIPLLTKSSWNSSPTPNSRIPVNVKTETSTVADNIQITKTWGLVDGLSPCCQGFTPILTTYETLDCPEKEKQSHNISLWQETCSKSDAWTITLDLCEQKKIISPCAKRASYKTVLLLFTASI